MFAHIAWNFFAHKGKWQLNYRGRLYSAQNIVKKIPGRAMQNSLATAGTNFTKPWRSVHHICSNSELGFNSTAYSTSRNMICLPWCWWWWWWQCLATLKAVAAFYCWQWLSHSSSSGQQMEISMPMKLRSKFWLVSRTSRRILVGQCAHGLPSLFGVHLYLCLKTYRFNLGTDIHVQLYCISFSF